jgi:hypothetical protein
MWDIGVNVVNTVVFVTKYKLALSLDMMLSFLMNTRVNGYVCSSEALM